MKVCIRLLPILGIVGLLLAGCTSDKGGGPAPPSDPQGYIDQGWSQYNSGDYNGAYQSFSNAVNQVNEQLLSVHNDSVIAVSTGDSLALAQAVATMNALRVLVVDALSGIGWTTIKDIQPASGTLAFNNGLQIVEDLENMNPPVDSLVISAFRAELLAGYAILLQTTEDWQQSTERVSALLDVDANWQFAHDSQINYLDLRLIRAENYYYLADFPASRDEALALNTILNYQPGLSASDFNLATIEGRAALIELIEALDNLI